MDKFIEEAVESEDEMSELLITQKQTILEAEKQIMELQKIIEQLKNKPTCSTSTQTAHTETAATIGTQTSLTEASVGQNELVECSIEYEPNLEELAEENPEADRTPLVTTKEATASIDSTIDGIYLTTPLQETPKSKLLIIGDEYSNGFSRVMEKVTAPDNRIHLANNPIGNTVLKNVKITDKPDTHPKVAMLDSFLEIQPTPTLVV
ncbi:hypothetical protein JTB14_000456 [Gonioctena quinquepunctata]|nr:hypothetical protein JTB14_000456 [Gonioctena quinquepunctata]